MGWGNSRGSWGSAVGSCVSLYSYPHAQRHFESRGAVRSPRWKANERPLYKTRNTEFALVKDEDHYDLKYFNTPMVRYFAPHLDGSYHVFLRGGSSEFLHNHGWNTWSKILITTRGEEVFVPLNPRVTTFHEEWSAKLVFDKAGNLMKEESSHLPVYRYVSSTIEKADRAASLKRIEGLLTMCTLRIPTYHANATISYDKGAPFARGKFYDERSRVQEMMSISQAFWSDALVEALLEYAQEVYNLSLSKVAYNTGCLHYGSYLPDVIAALPHITPEAFRKSLTRFLLTRSGKDRGHMTVPLPFFPDSLPKRYFYR